MMFQQAPFSDRLNFGWFLNTSELINKGVEVGTYQGGFARRLLSVWLGNVLYCVDPYVGGYDQEDPLSHKVGPDDLTIAKRVLEPYRGRVEHWLLDSATAAKRFNKHSVGFVYLDGNHQPGPTYNALKDWWPVVHPGGILAGHDFLEPGVRWGEKVQPAVIRFMIEYDVDCYLVTEPSGAPWSFYFVKPPSPTGAAW